MATSTTYTFTITPFNSDQFTALILQSTISTALDHIATDGSTVNILFKDVLSSGDETTLDGLASAYTYAPPSATQSPISVVSAGPLNPDGVPIHEMALRKSVPGFSSFTIVSHDFSDRTTWYQKSVAVTGETLSDSGDGLLFNSANANWINMNSPKLTYDYKKILERDGTLSNAVTRLVGITSNGTALVENVNYTVDYPNGKVTFASSQSGNTIVAKYYHNNGVTACSEFLFTPPPSTMYRIEHVEAQFSKNTAFNNSSVILETWAGAVSSGTTVNLAGYGGFSPTYYDLGYGQSRSIYRNMNDLINWCTNEYPIIPACGTLSNDILCFPFLYVVHPTVSAKQGALVRLCMTGDIAVTAEICTVTLYMEKGPA